MFSSVNSLYWYNKKKIPVELSFFSLASKKHYVISETARNIPSLAGFGFRVLHLGLGLGLTFGFGMGLGFGVGSGLGVGLDFSLV